MMLLVEGEEKFNRQRAQDVEDRAARGGDARGKVQERAPDRAREDVHQDVDPEDVPKPR